MAGQLQDVAPIESDIKEEYGSAPKVEPTSEEHEDEESQEGWPMPDQSDTPPEWPDPTVD